jgi:hypothetical protein
MERRAPTPVCKCFLLCRQIFLDRVRHDYTLVSPVHQIFSLQYPVVQDLSVFARWTNAHGAYQVELQLRSLEGDVLWRQQQARPFETSNPLEVWILTLEHMAIPILGPGKYEIALLADGREVAADMLQAHQLRWAKTPEG